jgi:hypothetical protein
MLDLSSFTTENTVVTSNWSDLLLYAIDQKSKKMVLVASAPYYTGAESCHQNATKERAINNVDNFIKYITKNNITQLGAWHKVPPKVRYVFGQCFNQENPRFH